MSWADNHRPERDHDCVIMPLTQTSTPQDLEPPVKKIHLVENKHEHQQELEARIQQLNNTPLYIPQVEPISPKSFFDDILEDATFRSTKDDLLQQISKIDREISEAESTIQKLRKKEKILAEAAYQPNENKDKEEGLVQQPKYQSLAQKIYAENRIKAKKSHFELEKLGPKVELPLYNQPTDTAVYNINRINYILFKGKLVEHLRKKNKDKEEREKYLTQTYSRLVQEWHQKVSKIENSAIRKAKNVKNREFFEKVFPVLKKAREDRVRFNRLDTRIRSEADEEEVVDKLEEQESEVEMMRSYAVIPPLLLDSQQRRYKYVNNNGKIEDFTAEYKERQVLNVWTKEEKEIFKEKLMQHAKHFYMIASYLERKSICDCIQYYYHSKKEENYKRLLRKSKQWARSGRNPHGKVNNANGAISSELMDSILRSAPGVTTRLQREQLLRQERSTTPKPPPAPSEALSVPPKPICDTLETENNNPSPMVLTVTVTSPPCEVLNTASHSAPSPITATSENNNSKKKEKRKDKKKKKNIPRKTKDDEPPDPRNGEKSLQTCLVCKTESKKMRILPRSHALQYGLHEENIAPGARVCNSCRCKTE